MLLSFELAGPVVADALCENTCRKSYHLHCVPSHAGQGRLSVRACFYRTQSSMAAASSSASDPEYRLAWAGAHAAAHDTAGVTGGRSYEAALRDAISRHAEDLGVAATGLDFPASPLSVFTFVYGAKVRPWRLDPLCIPPGRCGDSAVRTPPTHAATFAHGGLISPLLPRHPFPRHPPLLRSRRSGHRCCRGGVCSLSGLVRI